MYATPYATLDDMRLRFGERELIELSDPEAQATLNEAAVTAALTDAADLIDSYVAGRYRVPLMPVPAPVRRWCADIARFYLDTLRSNETIRKAYEDALAGLKDVARGMVVFQAEGAVTPESGSVQVADGGARRVFTQNSLRGF